MVHLFRLILALCLSWLSLPASAVIPMGDPWDTSSCNASMYQQDIGGTNGGAWECQAGTGSNPMVRNCGVKYPNGYFSSKCTQEAVNPVCPPHSTGVGNVCVCTQGYEEVGGSCQQIGVNADRDTCAAFGAVNTLPGGALVQEYNLKGKVPHGAVYCMPGAFDNPNKGCKVTFDRESFVDWGGGNSVSSGQFNMSPNASTIDQSCVIGDVDSPGKVPDQEKCKTGYTGTVNGVEVCVNKVPDSGVGGEKESTEETKDNETKKTTKDSQTECKNGVCTTTTTTTTTTTNNTTGTSTTTTSTTTTSKPQAGFCTENPKSKLCSDGDDKGSSFGGTCSAGFKCEGDAIQCAISQEQHRRACKLFDDKSAESDLYNENKGKTGNQTTELPGNETIDMAGRIDTSDAIGGGACIADINVTVWGSSISLPFAQLCPYLLMLGNVLVAVSMLMAARIIFRG